MSKIVIVMGYPAAGKTSLVKEYTDQGYTRINRDELGGSLDDQAKHALKLIKDGLRFLVLDNTYGTIENRKSIIALAKKENIPIDCVWLKSSLEDAQFNACARMIEKEGKLLMPGEYGKTPNMFPPATLFAYRKNFETPKKDEGFAKVEKVAFARRKNPKFANKALILDYDQTLRETKAGASEKYPIKPEEVEMIPGCAKKLTEYKKQGYILLGVSNQSGIAKGKLTEADARACFDETNRQLGHDIEYYFCPHNIPPVRCYCRKPHCGLGVMLIYKHQLDPSQCIFVGDQTSDKTFAARSGFQYSDQKDFFGA